MDCSIPHHNLNRLRHNHHDLQPAPGIGQSGNLAGWHSYCSQIPRVYSGFAYGYCTLNAPERYGVHDSAPIAAADMLLSGITDTLVLPYTIYQQNELGVIPVTRKQR